jgi:putative endonuclease
MNYYVYILHSYSTSRYYKGVTNDLKRRLKEHNKSQEKATKAGVPWELVWYTSKPSKGQAMILERKLKNIGTQKRLEDFMFRHSVGGPDDQHS